MTKAVPHPENASAIRRAWRHFAILFSLSTALLYALFHQAVAAMVGTWMNSDTFGYGFLILPIVVFLAYRRRRQWLALAPSPWFWALLWISGALLIHLLGAAGNVMLLQQIAFVALWQGVFALFAGWKVVRRLFFPLAFAIFMVPIGEEAVPYLQTITAEISVFLLRASGVPTYHSGILIEIPSGSFVVADVCSGARFLITTVVLGTLATNLFFTSWRRRAIFMLLCVLVPILANGLRAYGIILLAHLTDHELAISVDHIIYGFLFLFVVLLILTGVGALFRDRWEGDEAEAPQSSRAGAPLSSSLLALAAMTIMLLGTGLWSSNMAAAPTLAKTADISIIEPGGDWIPSSTTIADWSPSFPGADVQYLQRYQAASGEVAFFAAAYLHQRGGREIIASGNSFIGSGRERLVTRFEKRGVGKGRDAFTVQETIVRLGGGERIIWSWYDIGGSRTSSKVEGKLLEIWKRLSWGSETATAFAITTEVGVELSEARERLEDFINALVASSAPARPRSASSE
jgi:exosortase A